MIHDSTKHIPFVNVDYFDATTYTADYAKQIGASFLLRGIRSVADYEYERTMRHMNADHEPDITTVLLMPPREYSEVSSSVVKGLIGPVGWEKWVARYVPPPVLERLMEYHETLNQS